MSTSGSHCLCVSNFFFFLISVALAADFFPDPIDGLYTHNASAPLGVQAGLRQLYKFGFYSHCAYVDDRLGICSNRSVATKFRPYEAIISDMASNYSGYTNTFIPLSNSFRADASLGSSTQAAYWLILMGMIFAALALFTYVPFPSSMTEIFQPVRFSSAVSPNTPSPSWPRLCLPSWVH